MTFGHFKNLFKKLKAATAGIVVTTVLSGSLFGVSYAADVTAPILDNGPEITSDSAVVMDINSGAVLYSKNGSATHQPSSLTKLMNAYVVLDNLTTDTTITCSATATSQNFELAANAGFVTGETCTVKDALVGMLLASDEDCAYALAENTSGSMERFSVSMNETASKMGLLNSSFTNGTGVFAAEHYSTAYDMAVVASKLVKDFPEAREILSSSKAEIGATNLSPAREVKSSHRFMGGGEKVDNVYAGKTGGSAHGGDGSWSLATYASSGGLNVVCIIMGSKTLNGAYSDTKTLINYALTNYEAASSASFLSGDLTEMGLFFSECPFFDVTGQDSIYLENNASIVLPLGSSADAITSAVVYKQIDDFEYGENVIGSIDFTLNDRYIGGTDIIFYSSVNSMTHEEFLSLFPSFLIDPENTSLAQAAANTTKATSHKPGFFTRVKNSILSLYTTARLYSFLFAIGLFALGLVLILVFFPKPKGNNQELYIKNYDRPEDESGVELSEVRRLRNDSYSDMHEIK